MFVLLFFYYEKLKKNSVYTEKAFLTQKIWIETVIFS